MALESNERMDSLLAGLAGLSVGPAGGSARNPLVLDDADELPVAERTRPVVDSSFRPMIASDEVKRLLRARGARLGGASMDGNCAQRSILCSVGRISQADALAPAGKRIRDERRQVVDRIVSRGTDADEERLGTSLPQMRRHLGLPADPAQAEAALAAFRASGYWTSTGAAFTLFLWGLADLVDRPVVVLHRDTATESVVDPVCVYRARRPLAGPGEGLRAENRGVFAMLPFSDVLRALDDWREAGDGPDSSRTDPPVAIVEFVPGHFSPFVISRNS